VNQSCVPGTKRSGLFCMLCFQPLPVRTSSCDLECDPYGPTRMSTALHRGQLVNITRPRLCVSCASFPPLDTSAKLRLQTGTTGLDARNGLSLACNSCGFHRLHSRVNVPGLLLRFRANRFRCPFRPRLHHRSAVCSTTGRFNASDPLPLPRLTRPAAYPTSTPLQDCYIPPD
jgi:hypothetical protein